MTRASARVRLVFDRQDMWCGVLSLSGAFWQLFTGYEPVKKKSLKSPFSYYDALYRVHCADLSR